MRKGQKLYLKHLAANMLLIAVIIIVTDYEIIDTTSLLYYVLFFAVWLYGIVFIIGYVFAIGPLKHIKRKLADDYEEELKEYERPKQPWE